MHDFARRLRNQAQSPRPNGGAGCSVRKAPENRYPTMRALLEDIERVAQGKRAQGVRLRQTPDCYQPQSSMGREALALLTRHHRSSRPSR